MVEMPEEIKEGLRELDRSSRRANKIENVLEILFLRYGVNPDALRGLGTEIVKTEAFSDIVNCKGDIEENIREIEKVFLHYANRVNQ